MKINQVVNESPQLCPECGGPAFSDLMLAEKQDACYSKVRSRYKVWPSAYASGALVQCRKKGAANWGNKSKNEDVAEGLADEFAAMARARGMNPRIHGTPDEERARSQQILAQRAKERDAAAVQAAADDAKILPELKAEYDALFKKYNSLGGRNWQYADREQNLTDREREARGIEPKLNQLAGRIARAEKSQGVAEGEEDLVQIEYWQQETMESGRWVKTKPIPRATAEKIVNSFERGEIVDVEQGVAEGDISQLEKDVADAPVKPIANMESATDSNGYAVDREDAGEYDYEGDQAKDQLRTIVAAARKLNGILDDNENMPEWVQMKITKATDYLDTAADYVAANKAQAEPMEEGKKKEPPEADYGPDYQDMVARVKKLAGLGPLKTVWDPQKRVYKNVPTAVQPRDKK